MQRNPIGRSSPNVRSVLIAAGALVLLVVLAAVLSPHIYLFTKIDAQEVGVRFRAGRIFRVVGPGVYSDFGWYANIKTVKVEAVTFSVTDPEVITQDRQRVGLEVSGDAFRPNIGQVDTLTNLWPKYQRLYVDDEALRARIIDLVLQAMKSCVGDRSFNESVIGASRDELRLCVDSETNRLANELGLTVKNVAIPNVILAPEAQASLDRITQSRLDTELAQQDAIKAREQTAADQARQEGEVRVTLARQQEEVRQQTNLAQLQETRLKAELVVIEAQKANDLLTAQRDLEINAVQAEAALTAARAALAQDIVLAELYAQNPDYAYLQAVQLNASALSATDKLIFTPEGTTPTIVVPGTGILPTIDTGVTAETGVVTESP